MARRFWFVVPGHPVSWQRAGSFGAVRFTPAKQRDYQKLVRYHAVEAVPEGWPLENEAGYRVRVAIYLGRRVRSDIDNLAKTVLDALQGTKKVPPIAYDDDWRIVDLQILKSVDREDPRAIVDVEAL